jgi:hypothetical protein
MLQRSRGDRLWCGDRRARKYELWDGAVRDSIARDGDEDTRLHMARAQGNAAETSLCHTEYKERVGGVIVWRKRQKILAARGMGQSHA